MSSLISRARQSIAQFIAPGSGGVSPLVAGARGSNPGGQPYDAGSSGRRARGWNPSRLGPTSSLYTAFDKVLARSRDQVRNNPWGISASDNFKAQVISTGIRPRWKIKNKSRREQIEREFNRWATECDFHGQLSFWGLQEQAAGEVFEGGEVFTRMYTRPASFGLCVPLQLQLIEAEQLPVFKNNPGGNASAGNAVRTGIEFDSYGRRVAYHFYNAHPGETMFYPLNGLQFVRIPAEDVIHTYKPSRAGQLRGVPHLSAVLTLLYELEQYTDAELDRKKIQTMFSVFITKQSTDTDVIPINPSTGNLPPGVGEAKLESGTVQELLPGEDIRFPTLPVDMDFEAFIRVEGHRFAVGCGMTYEQLTGDLKGVNYSSIRAGLLDFRRKCELLQFNIFVHQFCQPIIKRWLKEAFLSGRLNLPGYAQDPHKYEDVLWTPSGWDWVDPLKDTQAEIMAIRAGLSTRAHSVSQRGRDVAVLDEEWKADADRADDLGLVYDTDPRKILFKSKANPTDPVLLNANEDANGDDSGAEDGGGDSAGGGDSGKPPARPRAAQLYALLP